MQDLILFVRPAQGHVLGSKAVQAMGVFDRNTEGDTPLRVLPDVEAMVTFLKPLGTVFTDEMADAVRRGEMTGLRTTYDAFKDLVRLQEKREISSGDRAG